MRSLLGAAIEEEADVTLVDMEAGLEHLSRSGGTLAYADVLLMIMEPSRKSILTAGRTIALAHELGIPLVYGVGNKAHLPEDAEFFRSVAAADASTGVGTGPDYSSSELGAGTQLGYIGIDVGLDPLELVDFLGGIVGLDPSEADRIPVLPRSLVVGTGNGAITPADLLRDYGVPTPSEVTLLNAMAITQAGAG